MKTLFAIVAMMMTGCAAQVAPASTKDHVAASACDVPASVTAYAEETKATAPGTASTFLLSQPDGTRWEIAPGGYFIRTTDAGSDVGTLLCLVGQGNRLMFDRSAL